MLPKLDLSLLFACRVAQDFLVFDVILDILNCSVFIFAQGHDIHLNYTKAFL